VNAYEEACLRLEYARKRRERAKRTLADAAWRLNEAEKFQARCEIWLSAYESKPGIPLPEYREEASTDA
jgi:hypothetical protein